MDKQMMPKLRLWGSIAFMTLALGHLVAIILGFRPVESFMVMGCAYISFAEGTRGGRLRLFGRRGK